MKDPYTEVGDIIEKWIIDNHYYYADYLVTLTLDGSLITTILKFNGNLVEFEWDDDWWEGEKVELIGFAMVGDIYVLGNPLLPNVKSYFQPIIQAEEGE